MSRESVTSSKREMVTSEMMQELDAIRSMNSSLRTYLEHLRTFRKNITSMENNYRNLAKVNSQWVELLNKNST